ncbi:MAG: 7-cyano-7-deazaguanine synthase QueC [bacterium]
MRNKDRYIVLLSGGLDSTVNLKLAAEKGKVLLALTFDYGQLAREKEIEKSAIICREIGVPHKVVQLPWLKELSRSGLISGDIPKIDDEKEIGKQTMEMVWIPARNLVFVAIAVAFAESMEADAVICGFNKEEGETFPDNSPQFVAKVNALLPFASLRKIELISFTQTLEKWEIAKLGWEIGAPLVDCWPCYRGGEEICGECESCFRFLSALRKAGIYDSWREKRRC